MVIISVFSDVSLKISCQYNGYDDGDRGRYPNYNTGSGLRGGNGGGNDDYPFRDDNDYRNDERYRIEQERQQRIDEANLRRVLTDFDDRSALECSLNVAAQWNFETNVNKITQQEAVKFSFKSNFIHNCVH